MKTIALIPARKGSKRLPHKNVLKINNKALIEYAIEQAKNSAYIDKIIVSSDDSMVREITDRYKNDRTIFRQRPKRLCKDDVSQMGVIRDLETKYKFDVLVLLQPTSPIRETRDIDKCIKLLLDGGFDSVVTVCRKIDFLFYPNGNIYVIRRGKELFSENMACMILNAEKSIDIDTKLDFRMAKFVLEKNCKEKGVKK